MRYTLLSQLLVSTALGSVLPKRAVWQAPVGGSWQIVLTGAVNPSSGLTPDVQVYDVDLFDTPAETIQSLKSMGKTVMCYFSAGTSEDWRPDWSQFQAADKGACLPDWPGEKWLNVKSDSVFTIMEARMDMAVEKGCDAIDPDNMDGYSNQNGGGIGLTTADSVAYLQKLASAASSRGMAIGLKNAQEILPDVSSFVQFAVNEECAANEGDCAAYDSFDKPVYHIEYTNSKSAGDTSKFCVEQGKFSTVIKTLDLDGWVEYCDGSSTTTPTADTGTNKGGQETC